jgi:hypothetical protein
MGVIAVRRCLKHVSEFGEAGDHVAEPEKGAATDACARHSFPRLGALNMHQ